MQKSVSQKGKSSAQSFPSKLNIHACIGELIKLINFV